MRGEGKRVYVITWDIDPQNKAKSRMFYYYLKKIREKAKADKEGLPTSVFETPDKKIARQVYELCKKYDYRVRVYRGVVLECD